MLVLAVDKESVSVVQTSDLCFRVPLGRSSMNVKVLATVMSSHTHRLLHVLPEGLWIPRNIYLVSRGVCSSLAEEPSFSFLIQLL